MEKNIFKELTELSFDESQEYDIFKLRFYSQVAMGVGLFFMLWVALNPWLILIVASTLICGIGLNYVFWRCPSCEYGLPTKSDLTARSHCPNCGEMLNKKLKETQVATYRADALKIGAILYFSIFFSAILIAIGTHHNTKNEKLVREQIIERLSEETAYEPYLDMLRDGDERRYVRLEYPDSKKKVYLNVWSRNGRMEIEGELVRASKLGDLKVSIVDGEGQIVSRRTLKP